MVSRVALNDMQQDREETIRSFCARLRGQASVCQYTIQCPNCEHDVDYTEPILRDALCRGIEDTEIQLNLLGHTNRDMSLNEVVHFVEAVAPATCLLYTSPSPRDATLSRMPSSA